MHEFLLPVVIMLIAAKVGGEVCQRYLKQPAVLGELILGIIVGKSALGWVNGDDATLQSLAELGSVFLLFEVGLESDIVELFKVGPLALWVAIVGVTLPFALGYFTGVAFGFGSFESLFMGAALTATSVGITARVFSDLGALRSREAGIVMGAAVADDVIGLIVLAAVSGLAQTGRFSSSAVLKVTGIATAFLVGAVVVGLKASPFLLRVAQKMRTRAAVSSAAIVICLVLAVVSERAGLAAIVGAFAAGLVLAKTEHNFHFQAKITSIADLVVPLFFVLMGAQVSVTALNGTTVLITALLFGVGVVGKVLAGLSTPSKNLRRWIVGIGMVPRGEVGLIFATVGLSHKLIGPDVYAAIILVVVATTFITPSLLKFAIERGAAPKSGQAKQAVSNA